MKKEYESPVYHVRRVPVEKVRANSYNPNHVAPPEMKLHPPSGCCGLLRDCSGWPLITSSSPKVTAPEGTGRPSNGTTTMSMIFWILTGMFV